MFNRRTLSIIKRELREKVLSRSFIFMTLLVPAIMFGTLGLQMALLNYDSNTTASLQVTCETPQLAVNVSSEFAKLPQVENRNFKITYNFMPKNDFDNMLPLLKKDLLSDKLTGVIFIPNSALTDKKVNYYSKNPNNISLFNKFRSAINSALIDMHFADKQLSEKEISYAGQGVDFNSFRISNDTKIKAEGIGNQVVSFLFTFLLYLSMILLGTMMMRSVVQEKNNRIVEVLLSSVNSKELMAGKIIGTTITGVAQMIIWLMPLVLVISSSIFVLPADFTIDISLAQIGFVLFNFLVGLITFLGLFATVGAIFDNDQDAQSGIWPIMMLIMIPFFIGITLVNNPENTIGVVASMLPFASIIVMPARMTLVDVPGWQFALAIVVNLATMFVIFPLSGKIYRVGILMSGKKPKWGEVVQWLKYKY
ncbi:MAG: ABC transporter permease [Ignavibacteriaceae bacterium]|nr:ABC transporter permease [Ignavibacteriaceae bacterium]